MRNQPPDETEATAVVSTVCVEWDRHDISVLLDRKPQAGMDLLTVLGKQFHGSQHLVRVRASRNPNEMIEEIATVGDRLADGVARFGGSSRFIIIFGVVLAIYTWINVALGKSAWAPYPFILLNPVL